MDKREAQLLSLRARWVSLQPGIYCKAPGDGLDLTNDGLSDPRTDLFEVLMFNNMQWYYLDGETWGWEEVAESYDPTEGGAPMIKITGPDLPGVMSTKRVRVR